MKPSDIAGQKFGMLTVVEDSGSRQGNSILWRCKCDCGGGMLATRPQLESGNVTGCGCAPGHCASERQAEDLTGHRFGKLTVLRRAEDDGDGSGLWLCRYGCGKEVTVTALLKPNSSGYSGVYFHQESGKWHAQITVKSRTYFLGGFQSLEEAATACKRGEEMYVAFLRWYCNEYLKTDRSACRGR